VRALGAGGGDLAGSPFEPSAAARAAFEQLGEQSADPSSPVSAESVLWTARLTREFRVPRRLGATPFGCNAQRSTESAACLDRLPPPELRSVLPSGTGAYQPFSYLLPGALMRAAETPTGALRLGRIGSGAIATLLLVLAVAALAGRQAGGLSLLGVAAAVTPMVVFSASLLSASGPEIAAAVLVLAALLRLTRPDPAPWWVGAGLVAGAVVLVVTRFLGPVVLVLALLAVAVARPPGCLRSVLARNGRRSAIAAAGVAAATAAGLAWQLTYMPEPELTVSRLTGAVAPSVAELPGVLRQAVGDFGALDTPLPVPVVLVWWALVAALVAGGLRLGGRRERVAIAGLGVVVLALTVAVDVGERQTGYSVQGRHVLPALVALPLLAGEVVWGRRAAVGAQALARLSIAGFALVAGVHFVAWWTSARRWAVGTDGPLLFTSAVEWAPPGGWAPWIATAALAAVLLAAAGPLLAREDPATASPARS